MKIDYKGNLEWSNNSKLCCVKNDWFDKHSKLHFISGYLLTNLVLFINIKNCKISNKRIFIIFTILSLLHILQDYLENVEINGIVYSIEVILLKIFEDNIFSKDKDTLQNFLGDNLSFMFGSGLVIYLFKRNKQNLLNYKGMVVLTIIFLIIQFTI